ncbi:thiol:disulfide interchange protein [Owenweeksia hongkongensis DSM 17368]|uniref:Thiol:disulfide interchange protein n=2 Tax=Owenweeksia TaxID=267986 RepID=G8R166_OWEHD|nr:thiol:disulfide interchange protein [Owenweeksia hongkongensis DSM 17368]
MIDIKFQKPQNLFTLRDLNKNLGMKKLLILATLFFAFQFVDAQVYDPVKWKYSVKYLEDNKAELQVTATIEDHWHVYSIEIPETSPVIGTEVTVEESSSFALNGPLREPTPIEEYDPNFDEILKWHAHNVTFTQPIKILSEKDFTIKGELMFMVCNESMCLPPEYIDISFKIKGKPQKAAATKSEEAKKAKPTINNDEVATEEEEETDASDIAPGVDEEKEEIDYAYTGEDTSATADATEEIVDDESPESGSSRSLLGIFILSFLGGFAALLTPCVFPMIPLTVSFFTKQSKNRAKGIANAMTYGLAIILIYTAIGFIIVKVFGSDALNALSTNPWMNLAFFALLVVFAISFFGAFEITLPSKWVNKSDQASDKGGIVGIFFMAFTLALVSFSCTGPIIGSLLVEAASGGYQGPLIGMFGFSLALALPFTLFAIFPGWLNSLPKSGGWLNSVKVVLGFIELAFAFKFLSAADLVWQAGILQREWFIAIWIAIFTLLTLYLLGKFRMPHDSPMDKVSVPRLLMAILSLFFVVYLIPGMWGAPLKLISGFPPPMFYSESPGGFGGSAKVVSAMSNEAIPEGADPEHCPLSLNCFHDFEDGLAYAKKVNKPIMLDFTGWGCVNCRKMEENVWSDPRVLEILREDVVLVSLYVDERKELPKEEQFVSDVTGKKVKTIGNKWSEFQVKHFKSNSQPQYILLNHDSMKPLNGSTAYDPDIDLYVNWLEEGIAKFEKNK